MQIIDKLADKLSHQVVQASPDKVDVEIVRYFLIRVFNQLIFWVIVVPLAILFNIALLAVLAVLLSFYPLRRCWGGAHLQNDTACLFVSVVTTLLAAWIATLILINIIIVLISYSIAFLIVTWTDVVDSPAKPIVKLRAEFRRQGYITLVALMILNSLFLFWGMPVIASALLLGTASSIISVIIGKIMYR